MYGFILRFDENVGRKDNSFLCIRGKCGCLFSILVGRFFFFLGRRVFIYYSRDRFFVVVVAGGF